MFGRRDSRTTQPRQVQLVVVMAKICPSAATVLFPRMTTNKRIRRLAETEFDFTLPRGERRSESSSQVTVAGTPSTLILWGTGPTTWRNHVHMNQFRQNRR